MSHKSRSSHTVMRASGRFFHQGDINGDILNFRG